MLFGEVPADHHGHGFTKEVVHSHKKRKLSNGSSNKIPVLYMNTTYEPSKNECDTETTHQGINDEEEEEEDWNVEEHQAPEEKEELVEFKGEPRVRFYAYCPCCEKTKGYFETESKEKEILSRYESRRYGFGLAPKRTRDSAFLQREEKRLLYSSLNYTECDNPESDPMGYGYQVGNFPRRKCNACRTKVTYEGRRNPYRHLTTTGSLNRVVKYGFYENRPTGKNSDSEQKILPEPKHVSQLEYRERNLGSSSVVPIHNVQKVYNKKEIEAKYPGLTDEASDHLKMSPLFSVRELKTGVNIPAHTKKDAVCDTFKLFWNSPYCINEYCENGALHYGYCRRCWNKLKRN